MRNELATMKSDRFTELEPAKALPLRIEQATTKLAQATTLRDVLDVLNQMQITYIAAKSAAQLIKARNEHDDALISCRRAQTDALLIELRAAIRIADEYDNAQKRGEVASRGGTGSNQYANIPKENICSTIAELGIAPKQIVAARLVRDAERVRPGAIEHMLEQTLQDGRAATRADVKRLALDIVTPPKTATPSHVEQRPVSNANLGRDGTATDAPETSSPSIIQYVTLASGEEVVQISSAQWEQLMGTFFFLFGMLRYSEEQIEERLGEELCHEYYSWLEKEYGL